MVIRLPVLGDGGLNQVQLSFEFTGTVPSTLFDMNKEQQLAGPAAVSYRNKILFIAHIIPAEGVLPRQGVNRVIHFLLFHCLIAFRKDKRENAGRIIHVHRLVVHKGTVRLPAGTVTNNRISPVHATLLLHRSVTRAVYQRHGRTEGIQFVETQDVPYIPGGGHGFDEQVGLPVFHGNPSQGVKTGGDALAKIMAVHTVRYKLGKHFFADEEGILRLAGQGGIIDHVWKLQLGE